MSIRNLDTQRFSKMFVCNNCCWWMLMSWGGDCAHAHYGHSNGVRQFSFIVFEKCFFDCCDLGRDCLFPIRAAPCSHWILTMWNLLKWRLMIWDGVGCPLPSWTHHWFSTDLKLVSIRFQWVGRKGVHFHFRHHTWSPRMDVHGSDSVLFSRNGGVSIFI